MGGNIILKFLGEQEHTVHPLFKKAVVFSVPCDLASTAMTLKTGFNMVYTLNFLRTLKQKVKQRENYLRKKGIDTHKVLKVKNLNEFDEAFTAPYYGFKSAVDYYEQVSAKRFLSGIKKPTLIVNALDDPFLTKECFPHQELENHPYVSLETPSFGGHVGFYTKDPRNVFWTEKRAYNFIQDKSVK
jgi:predicted alpha/beta-fold hydrolase